MNYSGPKSQKAKVVAKYIIRQAVSTGISRKEATAKSQIASKGSARTYTEALSTYLKSVMETNKCSADEAAKRLTTQHAKEYLADRAALVGQKQLDKDRRTLNLVLGAQLERVMSEKNVVESSRYIPVDEVVAVAARQAPHNALATRVAHEAGLRSAELRTLMRIEERSPDSRPETEGKWSGKEHWASYTVKGKGGLCRKVRLSPALAAELEKARAKGKGVRFKDRGIKGYSHYHIGGGNSWAASFNKAEKRVFGNSLGAHSVRHAYAQDSIRRYMSNGASFKQAVLRVSQELGHFRADIVFAYLR